MSNLVKSNIPVAIDLCLDQKANASQCKSGHSLVASGYRKVCSPTSSNCKEYVRVQNFWGADWQNQNSDGWVDAKVLYEYMYKDEKGVMSWVVPEE